MRSMRFGLQARFLAAMAIMLAVVLALLGTLLHRQKVMQQEVADLGRDAMHSMVEDSLRRHGEATVDQLGDALANPLYYFDLDAIGSIVRSAQKEPDVSYVLVYDNQGRIIHDGTADIAVYGQTMTDPLAYEAVNARGMHTQWSAQIVDVSEPIMIGSFPRIIATDWNRIHGRSLYTFFDCAQFGPLVWHLVVRPLDA